MRESGKELILDPEKYMSKKARSLEDRMKEISLSPQQEDEIIRKQTGRTIRDTVLGALPFGEAASALLEWNANVNSEIEDAKKNLLIESYFQQSDQNKSAVTGLVNLVTNPHGSTIFNKILQILEDNPPDLELTNHLASVLKNILEGNFIALFENHKYALSQIEKLTPQGLTILSDNKIWPRFLLAGYSATGGKITSEWILEFTDAYALVKNVSDRAIINRMGHSVNQLISSRLIEAFLFQPDEKIARASPTEIGKVIISYITPTEAV